jgi:hypothetical protein
MKLLFATLFFALALAGTTLPPALPIGQVLAQGDTAAVLVFQNYMPPGNPDHLRQFGLIVAVRSGRPNAATLQVKALIETEDGIRKWYHIEAPYQLIGSAWMPVFFNTGSQRVTAVYGLRVTVIDAGQEQNF